MPLFNYAAILPFAILGMLLCARERRADVILIYLFIFSVLLSTAIYFVNSRYRIIAVPYLCIFSAVTVRWLYDKIKGKNYSALAVSVAAIIVLLALTHVRVLGFGMAQAHNNLGIILKQQGRYDEAIKEYQAAIRINPRYDSPHFNLGLLYFEKKDYKRAIDSFSKTLELNPEFIKAYNYLGEAYAKTGRREEALFYWDQSLKLDPNQPDIRRLLGK